MSESTKIGLPENTVCAICYVPFIGWLAAIFFFLTEKAAIVRFHAFQALCIDVAVLIVSSILTRTIFLAYLTGSLTIVLVILQLYLVVQVYSAKEVNIPYITEFAKKQLKKE